MYHLDGKLYNYKVLGSTHISELFNFDIVVNENNLDFLLSLEPKNVIIGRMKITDKPSYYETYLAYDEIMTYSYHHNKENFLKICGKYDYQLKNINNNFYLYKNQK